MLEPTSCPLRRGLPALRSLLPLSPLALARVAAAGSTLALAGCGEGAIAPHEAAASSADEIGRAGQALSVEVLGESLRLSLDLEGEEIFLELHRQPAPAAEGYRSHRVDESGVLRELGADLPSCGYVGRAVPAGGEPSGFVAVSTCPDATGYPAGRAAAGVLFARGRLWQLTPAAGDDRVEDGVDHWLSAMRHPLDPPAAVSATRVWMHPESAAPTAEFREGTPQETKYIELLLVNDARRAALLGGQPELDSFQLIAAANAMLADSGLTPRVRIVLAGQVTFEADPFPLFDAGGGSLGAGEEVDHEAMLDSFLTWAGEQPGLPAHDEHLLLSGLDFLGSSAGLAPVGAACLGSEGGFLVQANESGDGPASAFAVLSTVHELGHTLGMDHDDGSPGCPESGFIMASVGCSNCNLAGIEFSPCSQQDFTEFLAGPLYQPARCADDVPGAPSAGSCGDGVVSPGESCDCGSGDCSGIDPCCNGSTCQLVAGAVCSDYNDACCVSCQVAAPDTVCRASRSECDTEEVCTGSSSRCPVDAFTAAGEACSDGAGNDGVCYLGDCQSRATQCAQLDAILTGQGAPIESPLVAPTGGCPRSCSVVTCTDANQACVQINGRDVLEGAECDSGQCVDGACVESVDQCPADPDKTEPGVCGCGAADADTDLDGTLDCLDDCPQDPGKTTAGVCGCGEPDTDSDSDTTPDCEDLCPLDALKDEPGQCGCGTFDQDVDSDGTADCNDQCPSDPDRTEPRSCGCGADTTDRDEDGTFDCDDACPDDPERAWPPCSQRSTDRSESEVVEGAGGNAALQGDRGDRLEIRTSGGCSAATGGAPGSLGWLGFALGAAGLWRRRRRTAR